MYVIFHFQLLFTSLLWVFVQAVVWPKMFYSDRINSVGNAQTEVNFVLILLTTAVFLSLIQHIFTALDWKYPAELILNRWPASQWCCKNATFVIFSSVQFQRTKSVIHKKQIIRSNALDVQALERKAIRQSANTSTDNHVGANSSYVHIVLLHNKLCFKSYINSVPVFLIHSCFAASDYRNYSTYSIIHPLQQAIFI